MPAKGHRKPHLNERGGCECACYRCLVVRMTEHNGHVDIRQLCSCKKCNGECPTEGRIVRVLGLQG